MSLHVGNGLSSPKLSSSIEVKEQLGASPLRRSLSRDFSETISKTERVATPECMSSISSSDGSVAFSPSPGQSTQESPDSRSSPVEDKESVLLASLYRKVPPKPPERKKSAGETPAHSCAETERIKRRQPRGPRVMQRCSTATPLPPERKIRKTWTQFRDKLISSSSSSTPISSEESTPRGLRTSSSISISSLPLLSPAEKKESPEIVPPEAPENVLSMVTDAISEHPKEVLAGAAITVGLLALSPTAPVFGVIGLAATATGYGASKKVESLREEKEKEEHELKRTNSHIDYLTHKALLERPLSPHSHQKFRELVIQSDQLRRRKSAGTLDLEITACRGLEGASFMASLLTGGAGVIEAVQGSIETASSLLGAGDDILSFGVTIASAAVDQDDANQDKSAT